MVYDSQAGGSGTMGSGLRTGFDVSRSFLLAFVFRFFPGWLLRFMRPR
jgi:hypothetical protein